MTDDTQGKPASLATDCVRDGAPPAADGVPEGSWAAVCRICHGSTWWEAWVSDGARWVQPVAHRQGRAIRWLPLPPWEGA